MPRTLTNREDQPGIHPIFLGKRAGQASGLAAERVLGCRASHGGQEGPVSVNFAFQRRSTGLELCEGHFHPSDVSIHSGKLVVWFEEEAEELFRLRMRGTRVHFQRF